MKKFILLFLILVLPRSVYAASNWDEFVSELANDEQIINIDNDITGNTNITISKDKMKGLVNEDFFEKESCKAFYTSLVRLKDKGIDADAATVLSSMDEELAKSFSGDLTLEMPYENPEKAADEIYIAIKNGKTNVNEIKSPEELSKIIELIKQQKNQAGG